MAKAEDPKPNTTAAAPKTAKVGEFTFDVGLPMPVKERAASPVGAKLAAMPVDASFLEPVTVPETIADPAEREKAFRDQARTVTNRLSGAIRRFKDAHPERVYSLRTVNTDKLGHGVRVYRNEDAPAKA